MRLLSLFVVLGWSMASVNAVNAATANYVEMQTNVGTITIELDWQKAPLSSQNFINYVNKGFYKNTIFHRSVKDFVIQGGGYDATLDNFRGTNEKQAGLNIEAPIVNEAGNGLSNIKYSIALARTSEPNSATSQFFFNTANNSELLDKSLNSAGYAVFGKAIDGLDVIDKIAAYGTIKTGYSEGVPYSEIYDCGFNFCMRKIVIQATYPLETLDDKSAWVRLNVEGNGKVTSSPVGISCGLSSKKCVLKKNKNSTIKLIAKSSSSYQFMGWSGDCSGTKTELTIQTKNGHHNCNATFAKK